MPLLPSSSFPMKIGSMIRMVPLFVSSAGAEAP